MSETTSVKTRIAEKIMSVMLTACIIFAGLSAIRIKAPNEAMAAEESANQMTSEQKSAESVRTEPAVMELSEKETAKDADAELLNLNTAAFEGMAAEIEKDEKFGAANTSVSAEELENAGIVTGDSCDLEFSNGLVLCDVPYYNGYYVKNGEPVMVAYPGNPTVMITYNNIGIWDKENLSDGDTVTIRLRESGKYGAIQETLGQAYSFDRADYDSDEQFSNFRALTGGNLRSEFLYRGASPVDNSRGRAAYTDGLLKDKGIGFIVDLADSEDNIKTYISEEDFASLYTEALYENDGIAMLSMGSGYTGDEYRQKLVSGLKRMVLSEGPVYIHCMEGKDRTGFVCTLLEALAGASYDEMLSDYMQTYANYYSVTKDGTPEKYLAIADLYFGGFMDCLHGEDCTLEELESADFTEDAAAYLEEGGMTAEEVESLREFITV